MAEMISELDTQIVLCCVIHLKTKEIFDVVMDKFAPLYCNLKRRAADACVFYEIGETAYVVIEVETIGQWLAKISEVAALPYVDKVSYDAKDLYCHYSSIISSMKEKIDLWEQYPSLHLSYSNSRGLVNGETLRSATPILLVSNLTFVDSEAKIRWSSRFESLILATSQEQRSPVSIFLDTAPLAGIVITIDSAEHWLSSGALIPGVVSSVSAGNSLDEGVASVTVHHVYCGEASECSHVTDRIASCVRGVQGCVLTSFRTVSGSFIGTS